VGVTQRRAPNRGPLLPSSRDHETEKARQVKGEAEPAEKVQNKNRTSVCVKDTCSGRRAVREKVIVSRRKEKKKIRLGAL